MQQTIGEYRISGNTKPTTEQLNNANIIKVLVSKMIDIVCPKVEGATTTVEQLVVEFNTLCVSLHDSTDNLEAQRCYQLAIANLTGAHQTYVQDSNVTGYIDLIECAGMWAIKGSVKPEMPSNL